MIADIFIKILLWFVDLIFWILPDWNLSESTWSAGETIVNAMVTLDGLFPVKTLLFCFGVIVIFELYIKISNLVVGLVALLRGSGKPEIK